MIVHVYIILLIAAIAGTTVVLRAGVSGEVGDAEMGARTGIVASVAVLVLWGLVAINSFEIIVFSNGSEFTQSYPQLAWIAVAGGAVSLYSLLQATLAEVNATGGI